MSGLEILEEACAALPHSTRAMFGGHGLFAPNGGMFAGIVDEGRIVLKLAAEPTRSQLIAIGGAPWVYNEKMTMKDWIVIPSSFYDEPSTLAAWAKRAHALAPPKVAKARKGAPPILKREPPGVTRRAPAKQAPKKANRSRLPKRAATTKKRAGTKKGASGTRKKK